MEPELQHEPRMSAEEWFALDEDIQGELLDGQLVEEETPTVEHELILRWFARMLEAWLRGAGIVLGSGVKYTLAADRGRKPDVSVFMHGRKPPLRGAVRIPPDIAIEIVSAAPRDKRRDRIEKMREYAEFGIRYYWLVDPEARSLEIYERQESGHYRWALGATLRVVTEVPGCAGLSLPLDALWQALDALED